MKLQIILLVLQVLVLLFSMHSYNTAKESLVMAERVSK